MKRNTMKEYRIRIEYGADTLELMETYEEEFPNINDLYQRAIEDQEFDCYEYKEFPTEINDLYVDDEVHYDWNNQIKFSKIEIPSKGLCRIGGWCKGSVEFTLALPKEEVLDTSRLAVIDVWDVAYQLQNGSIIKAEFVDDSESEDDGQTGETYYYNGVELQQVEQQEIALEMNFVENGILYYKPVKDITNLYARIKEYKLEVEESDSELVEVKSITVNNMDIHGWQENFSKIPVDKDYLFVTGIVGTAKSTHTLYLPMNEEFDAKRLIVVSPRKLQYQLSNGQIIDAEWGRYMDDIEKDWSAMKCYINGELVKE